MKIKLLFPCLILLFAGQLNAQDSEKSENSKAEKSSEEKNKDTKEKNYEDIVTDEAITDKGLFDLHQVDDKYYYEIPDSLFGREMLVVTRIAKTASGIGFGGGKQLSLIHI